MTTTAAEKVAGHSVVGKKDEKVEKRRALGRGLESLLPGPRVVVSPELRVPSTAQPQIPPAKDGEAASGVGHQAAEAVPFPVPVADSDLRGAEGGGGAGGKQVPFESPSPIGSGSLRAGSHFVRNDKALERAGDDSIGEGQASEELQATRAGAPAPYEQLPHEPSEGIEIQAVAEESTPRNVVVNLALGAIDKNPYQTRYLFDEEMLAELAESIKQNGVVQPVVVRPAADEGRYVLVLGERRLRASKLAGKETIPALVRRVSLQQAAEMTVLENVQREDLNAIEQAEAFRVLSKEFHLTQAQIAERIGVSRETVSNYMRLLRLPEEVMKYVLDGRLAFSDAREILSLDNPAHIQKVADEVVTKHLKWDEIEERVRELNGFVAMQNAEGAEQRRIGRARWMDPNVRAAQTEMEQTLGMRVRIKDRNGKGSILIEYATVDDYQRVVEMLRGKKK